LKGRDDFRKQDADGRIILKWNLNSVCRCGLNLSSSGDNLVASFRKHGTEPLDSVKGGEFLDWLRD
jgi:hypothetical protein